MAKKAADPTAEEIARRRDDAIKRALTTPHTPTKAIKGKTREKPKNVLTNAQATQAKPDRKAKR